MRGLISKLPFAEYRAAPGVNATALNWLAKSPAHARYFLQHPPEPTEPMRIGSAVHHALLSADWDEAPYSFKADGKPLERVAAIVAAVKAHPAAWGALGGETEASVFLNARDLSDLLPDMAVKGRVDAIPAGFLADLKVVASAEPAAFQRAAWDRGYHRSAAFYLDLVRAAGREADSFLWVAVENQPPHAICLHYASAESALVEEGRRQYRDLLVRFHECEKTGNWPGYASEPQEITAPAWAKRTS